LGGDSSNARCRRGIRLNGDINDFAWSPDGKEFDLIVGSIPEHNGDDRASLVVSERSSGKVLRTLGDNATDDSRGRQTVDGFHFRNTLRRNAPVGGR
jgi:hypothetical protein